MDLYQSEGISMEASAPRGFRDYLPKESARREAISYRIGQLFSEAGYGLIETPVVEGLDVLQTGLRNDAGNSFRFVDIDGRMLALRNDLTVPIARIVATRFAHIDPPYRLRYCADVYREQESLRGQARQITQLGIESIGEGTVEADAEVVELAIQGLIEAGLQNFTVHISDVSIFTRIASEYQPNSGWAAQVCEAAHSGDYIKVQELCSNPNLDPNASRALQTLLMTKGGAEALGVCEETLGTLSKAATQSLDRLSALVNKLIAAGLEQYIVVDFSVMREFSYYTGMVFEIYAPSTTEALGGGGRYDTVLTSFGRDLPAAGFVYNLDVVIDALVAPDMSRSGRLRIAVPKGSLFAASVELLRQAGFDVTTLENPGRQLYIETEKADFIIAKPTDVAIYVSTGAADCGIGGRDILVEADFALLELVDLRFGGCKFIVAQPMGDDTTLAERSRMQGVVKVATKYPRLASNFFESIGVQAEMVKLNGNIELAPLIGIADVIVDITATGTTLSENNLKVIEDVLPSTARFVANLASARQNPEVYALADTITQLLASSASDER